MRWKFYWRDVVKNHLVLIEGCPTDIPFGNLSDVATSFPTLERLQKLWTDGTIHFRNLTEDEFKQLDDERLKQIDDGEINEPEPRKTRSDKGKRSRPSKAEKTSL